MDRPDPFPALRTGDRNALAQAITLVESTRPADQAAARDLIERCLPLAGKALRLGITGIPGVGKSTLIDALGMELLHKGHKVAVLAVDPSSERTHGSILGDKTRMTRLAQEVNAFIRPTAAGGMLGGVARRTREVMILCEAAGHDRILIETVGVGQSELEVDHLCDLNILLALAGAGDELQGIKRGIMETADLVVITKTGGGPSAHTTQARNDLRNAIHMLPLRASGRHPEVLLTDAVENQGIAALAQRIEALHGLDIASGHAMRRRQGQSLHWMHQAIRSGLAELFQDHPAVAARLPMVEAAVRDGRLSPFQAAEDLLQLLRTGGAPRS